MKQGNQLCFERRVPVSPCVVVPQDGVSRDDHAHNPIGAEVESNTHRHVRTVRRTTVARRLVRTNRSSTDAVTNGSPDLPVALRIQASGSSVDNRLISWYLDTMESRAADDSVDASARRSSMSIPSTRAASTADTASSVKPGIEARTGPEAVGMLVTPGATDKYRCAIPSSKPRTRISSRPPAKGPFRASGPLSPTPH